MTVEYLIGTLLLAPALIFQLSGMALRKTSHTAVGVACLFTASLLLAFYTVSGHAWLWLAFCVLTMLLSVWTLVSVRLAGKPN